MKEFVSADSNEKKAVYSRLEEEVKKLKGSSARFERFYGLLRFYFELCCEALTVYPHVYLQYINIYLYDFLICPFCLYQTWRPLLKTC